MPDSQISKLQITNPVTLEALKNAFNERGNPIPPDIDDSGKVIKEGYAPSLQYKEPLVWGNSTLANTVHNVLSVLPQLGDKLKSIQSGPTAETVKGLASSKLSSNFDSMVGTNIYGTTSQDGKIAINPLMSNDPLTVAHEMGHTKGLDEMGAQILEQLLQRATNARVINPTESPIERKLPSLPTDLLLNLLTMK